MRHKVIVTHEQGPQTIFEGDGPVIQLEQGAVGTILRPGDTVRVESVPDPPTPEPATDLKPGDIFRCPDDDYDNHVAAVGGGRVGFWWQEDDGSIEAGSDSQKDLATHAHIVSRVADVPLHRRVNLDSVIRQRSNGAIYALNSLYAVGDRGRVILRAKGDKGWREVSTELDDFDKKFEIVNLAMPYMTADVPATDGE